MLYGHKAFSRVTESLVKLCPRQNRCHNCFTTFRILFHRNQLAIGHTMAPHCPCNCTDFGRATLKLDQTLLYCAPHIDLMSMRPSSVSLWLWQTPSLMTLLQSDEKPANQTTQTHEPRECVYKLSATPSCSLQLSFITLVCHCMVGPHG